MNKVEAQAEGNRWAVDESDLDYDTEASLSDNDGSEGEVPVVTGVVKEAGDVKETDPSSKPLLGAVKPHSKIAVWSSKSSAIATPVPIDGSFTRGWKPVIDGKIQVGGEAAALKVRRSSMQAASTGTSSQKNSSSDNASASAAATGVSEPKKDGNESDSDVRRVPEMFAKGGPSGATSAHPQGQSSVSRSRKRGGAPADKEHKRLKRLLRNRVSAQQARERKKAYLGDLEVRSKELQQRNAELEERVSTLQHENYMLRQIVKTTALKKPASGGTGTEI